MPTAMRPGKALQASSTKAGFLAAALPRMTRRMPASSQAAIPAMSRMPPPSCTGIVTLARIACTAAALTGLPAKAPFRSTTCSQRKPGVLPGPRLRARDRRHRRSPDPSRRGAAARSRRPSGRSPGRGSAPVTGRWPSISLRAQPLVIEQRRRPSCRAPGHSRDARPSGYSPCDSYSVIAAVWVSRTSRFST